jgi:hypothetical protein
LILLRTIRQHHGDELDPVTAPQRARSFRHVGHCAGNGALAVGLSGGASPPHEGAAAHLFPLFIVGQAPFAAYFAARWIPRDPGAAMLVLAMQAAAAVAALAPVVLFDL